MTSRWKPLSLVLVGGLIVGACTSAATPVPTAAPTAAASSNAPDGTLPAPELKSVKLGLLVGEPSQFAPQLAQMLGLYEKYGLTAQITIFNGDADAAAAVVSGSVDMGSVGASAAMNSQLTDRPAKVITIAKAKVIDGLFCGPSIKSAADLKGKSVAASTLGGTAHASILLALEALKMQPDDVVVQAVGGQSARIAALKGGSVACAPIGMEIKPDLDALGMNLLVDISTTGLEWPSAGIGATVEFLNKNPNTALAVAAAQLEAQNYMWTEPDKAADQWARFAQIDKARALELIRNVPDQLSRTLRWGDSAFPFVQRVLAIVSPGIMTVDAKTAQDRSYLEKLEELGFYRKLGIPLS